MEYGSVTLPERHTAKSERCLALVDLDKVDLAEVEKTGRILDRRFPIARQHTKLGRDYFFVNFKESAKRFPTFYYWMVKIVSPLYAPYMTRTTRRRLLQGYLDRNATIINIGSGNTPLDPSVINVDLFAYDNVDIATDATNLCLKDEVADFLVNESCLEHIYDFKAAIRESYRILKKGGRGYFNIPFLVGFHASPNDFHRFTHAGLKRLFEEHGFQVEELDVLSGPASSLLWVLIELLAMVFSLGWKPLYQVLYFVFMGLLFPIKFLDFFLNKLSLAKTIAATFSVVVSK